MVIPNWIIYPDAISHIKSNDFEYLCLQLLEFELRSRHPGSEIYGPPRRYAHDRGMDIQLLIRKLLGLGRRISTGR